jgi:hypothetical protein
MKGEKLALAEDFLEGAWDELRKYESTKDERFLREACEKGWGAVAQALKAVNPNIKRHADFGKTAIKLAKEYKDEEIFRCEAIGEHLHRAGFYEGLLDAEEIKYGLSAVEDFLKLIDKVLDSREKDML